MGTDEFEHGADVAIPVGTQYGFAHVVENGALPIAAGSGDVGVGWRVAEAEDRPIALGGRSSRGSRRGGGGR